MLTEKDFHGPARRLIDIDLPRIGKTVLNVGEDEIHAILTVESSGHGFYDDGRPVILFEPHVFYRHLASPERSIAVAQGLAYARWGEKPYPKNSYPHLLESLKINETAALLACSWGLGQILGENYRLCGYQTVQAMVHDMCQGEAEQLADMCAFIKANKLDGPLHTHEWAVFARGYNGKEYAKNHYDTRLAAAYAKWRTIPDTPWREDASEETRQNPPVAPPVIQAHEVTVDVPAPSTAPAPMPAPVEPPPPAPPAAAPKTAGGITAIAVGMAAYFHDHPIVIAIAVLAVIGAVIFGLRSHRS